MEKVILSNLDVEELTERISENLERRLKANVELNKNKFEQYLTRQETSKLLKISLVTLNTWTKTGVIPAYRLSRSVRYKLSDIEESFKEITSNKYARRAKF